jgi:hypothetical protein
MRNQAQLPFGDPLAANPERLRQMREFGSAEARRESLKSQTGAKREKVYQRIMEYAAAYAEGFTADEISACWHCSINHVAPRITELLQLGRLKMTGERRKTRAGGWAAVLAVRGDAE